MSEASAAQPAAMEGAAASSSQPSAGTLLREAREAAGLHIGALSVALKVPVKKLEALEADRHDLLPDAVFARALAASICRTLKIDAEPVLGRLPLHVMPPLELDSSTSDRANLHPSRALWHAPLLSRLPRPILMVAALLVVAAVVLYGMPSRTPAPLVPASSDAVTAPATGDKAPSNGSTAVPPAASAEPSAVAPSAPALSVPAAAPVFVASAASMPSSMVAPMAAGTPSSLLVFTARGASWVDVTDAAGVQQLHRTLNAGDVVPVSGVLPMSVVVGKVDAIDVAVRGLPFDLAGVARNNVARFQIK